MYSSFCRCRFFPYPDILFPRSMESWRAGAIDKRVKNAPEPVYVGEQKIPDSFSLIWWHISASDFIYRHDCLSYFLSLIFSLFFNY